MLRLVQTQYFYSLTSWLNPIQKGMKFYNISTLFHQSLIISYKIFVQKKIPILKLTKFQQFGCLCGYCPLHLAWLNQNQISLGLDFYQATH